MLDQSILNKRIEGKHKQTKSFVLLDDTTTQLKD